MQGRLSDLFGVRLLLRLSAFLFLVFALAILLLGSNFVLLVILLSFMLGFTRPAGQGFGRAAWQILYRKEDDRVAAASLDSIQSALVNGLAGALAVFLSQIIDPGLVLLFSASVASLAAVILAQSKIAPKLLHKQKKSRSSINLLSLYKLRLLLLVQIIFFIIDGFLVVSLLTLSSSLEIEAFGGAFVFLFLLGALYGAWRFGKEAGKHLEHRKEIARLLPRYAAALFLLPLALVSPFFLLLVLPLAGFQRRGFTPSVQTFVQEIVPLSRINEAIAFLYVALVIGSGLGRALAGPLENLPLLYLLIPAVLALVGFFFAQKLNRLQ